MRGTESGTSGARIGLRRLTMGWRGKRKNPGKTGACEFARIRAGKRHDPDGIRTRVAALKGPCPRPLDDGAGGRGADVPRGRKGNNMPMRRAASMNGEGLPSG